ncbi:hypothetical protein ABXS75_12445 [Roseburia hominis]
MKSKMVSCYDYTQLDVAEDLRKWRHPDSEIEEELTALAKDHSGESEVDEAVKEGDSVRCVCTCASTEGWCGRGILLYPGRSLPGAEEAEKAVTGKKAGDQFTCSLNGITLTLKVDKVVRKVVMQVCDGLVELLDIPGVHTVEDYYRWYHEQHDKEYKEKACIIISQFWLKEMSERSEFVIDEEEKRAWMFTRAELIYNAYERAGIDPHKRQDGTMMTTEEAMEELAKAQEMYFVPYLMYRYFCEKDHFKVTEEDMITEIGTMAKERGEKKEELMKQTNLDMFKMLKYQEHAFSLLMAEAEKLLEV